MCAHWATHRLLCLFGHDTALTGLRQGCPAWGSQLQPAESPSQGSEARSQLGHCCGEQGGSALVRDLGTHEHGSSGKAHIDFYLTQIAETHHEPSTGFFRQSFLMQPAYQVFQGRCQGSIRGAVLVIETATRGLSNP